MDDVEDPRRFSFEPRESLDYAHPLLQGSRSVSEDTVATRGAAAARGAATAAAAAAVPAGPFILRNRLLPKMARVQQQQQPQQPQSQQRQQSSQHPPQQLRHPQNGSLVAPPDHLTRPPIIAFSTSSRPSPGHTFPGTSSPTSPSFLAAPLQLISSPTPSSPGGNGGKPTVPSSVPSQGALSIVPASAEPSPVINMAAWTDSDGEDEFEFCSVEDGDLDDDDDDDVDVFAQVRVPLSAAPSVVRKIQQAKIEYVERMALEAAQRQREAMADAGISGPRIWRPLDLPLTTAHDDADANIGDSPVDENDDDDRPRPASPTFTRSPSAWSFAPSVLPRRSGSNSNTSASNCDADDDDGGTLEGTVAAAGPPSPSSAAFKNKAVAPPPPTSSAPQTLHLNHQLRPPIHTPAQPTRKLSRIDPAILAIDWLPPNVTPNGCFHSPRTTANSFWSIFGAVKLTNVAASKPVALAGEPASGSNLHTFKWSIELLPNAPLAKKNGRAALFSPPADPASVLVVPPQSLFIVRVSLDPAATLQPHQPLPAAAKAPTYSSPTHQKRRSDSRITDGTSPPPPPPGHSKRRSDGRSSFSLPATPLAPAVLAQAFDASLASAAPVVTLVSAELLEICALLAPSPPLPSSSGPSPPPRPTPPSPAATDTYCAVLAVTATFDPSAVVAAASTAAGGGLALSLAVPAAPPASSSAAPASAAAAPPPLPANPDGVYGPVRVSHAVRVAVTYVPRAPTPAASVATPRTWTAVVPVVVGTSN
ncbi:hypothetical protein DFJ73DRAFT_801101 [Zopfochytrium polystomum]|nr:hypothetical protein DFJ73DRAFT_801101 [Zopfochytrium polystomum]